MKTIQERIQNITIDAKSGFLLACGRNGSVFKFDAQLNLIGEAKQGRSAAPLSKIIVHNGTVFARDVFGTVTAWSLETLSLKRSLSGSEGMELYIPNSASPYSPLDVLPAVSHALYGFQNSIYTVSGNGTLVEFDSESLALKSSAELNESSFFETLDTAHPEDHVFSDFSGWLWKGNISDLRFEKWVRVDTGPSHCVVYDKIFDRYWATTDNSSGFALVQRQTGDMNHVSMTSDDVEWIAFNSDSSLAYVACFDHFLYVYSNEPTPKVVKTIGPFKFQLKQVLVDHQDDLFVLLESGEIYKYNAFGNVVAQSNFAGNCIWHIVNKFKNAGEFWASLEDGTVRDFKMLDGCNGALPTLVEQNIFAYPFGRLRRVVSTSDGGFIAASTLGVVFCATSEGTVFWKHQMTGICRDLALSPCLSKVVIGTEAAELVELCALRGVVLRSFKANSQVWAVKYHPDGRVFAGSRRKIGYVFDANEVHQVGSFQVPENIKGINFDPNGNALVNGPGYIARIHSSTLEVIQLASDGIYSSCEAVAQSKGKIFAAAYDLSLCTFDAVELQLQDRQVSALDFPKAILPMEDSKKETVLVVAGRGPVLSLFHLRFENPTPYLDIYVSTKKETE